MDKETKEVIIRANSTIKLKMPSGMTADWTYVKGTAAKSMLEDIARSLGYEVVEKCDPINRTDDLIVY